MGGFINHRYIRITRQQSNCSGVYITVMGSLTTPAILHPLPGQPVGFRSSVFRESGGHFPYNNFSESLASSLEETFGLCAKSANTNNADGVPAE